MKDFFIIEAKLEIGEEMSFIRNLKMMYLKKINVL